MAEGTIFDIKHYAIHDGPGIRTTVFFKGCPLSCDWCHNPESMNPEPEWFLQPERCPPDCSDCVDSCPRSALQRTDEGLQRDPANCTACGACAEACAYEALRLSGRRVSVPELVSEIEKDSIFFEESGGGVTVSGGEPLFQPRFLQALLATLKEQGYHLTVDTCGQADFSVLERVAALTDLFLYDLKVMDEERHRRYTGVSNRLILENLTRLSALGAEVAVRLPLLAGINDDAGNIRALAAFLGRLQGIRGIHLLPYHRGGLEKARRLASGRIGGEDPAPEGPAVGPSAVKAAFRPPSQQRLEEIHATFIDAGFTTHIGG